jgi:hypothetical protein
MMENGDNSCAVEQEFYHQTVTTEQIEEYLSAESGIDLNLFF